MKQNMKQNLNIEAEGSELILKNKAGDYVIIPKKYRTEVQDMLKDGCHSCIDSLVETLPVMDDYAEDGSLLPDWDKIKSTVKDIARPIYNEYKKLTTPDYSEYKTRGEAYRAARKAGEKEYMWNGQRLNTKYDGTAQQQLKETGITNNQFLQNNFIRDRIDKNLQDFEYHDNNQGGTGNPLFPIKKMKRIIIDNKPETEFLNVNGEVVPSKYTHKDLLSLYLGKPQKYNTTSISKYIPSDSKDKGKEYFSINDQDFNDYVLKHADSHYLQSGLKTGEIEYAKDKNGNIIPNRYLIKDIGTGLGKFTISISNDENGKYISYYDKWDLNPYKGEYSAADISNIEDLSLGIGKPFEIYNRIYYRENPDCNKFKEYDDKISKLQDLAIKTQNTKYEDEAYKLYPIRNSYYNKQNKYTRQYYSDKELSELDINKKNFDTLALQRELSNRGYKLPKSTKEDGTFDGIWGDETKNALLDYQTKNKPKPVVDKATGLDKYSKNQY